MTTEGRKFILARLSAAPDLKGLRKVWDSLGHEYARDHVIAAHKEQLKAKFVAEGQRL